MSQNSESIEVAKRELREAMRLKLKGQTLDAREANSNKIKERVLGNEDYQKAQVILFYCSQDQEVSTWGLIEQALQAGKTVLVPFVRQAEKLIFPHRIEDLDCLVPGSFGIMEPVFDEKQVVPPSSVDLVFVPGVAFDGEGNRLGRGGGYYDRFLKELDPRTTKVGLAFDFQRVNALPHDPSFDASVDYVLSN